MRKRNSIAVLAPLVASGCIGWFVATVRPMNTYGEWRGTVVEVPATDELSGEPVRLVGLRLTEESQAIRRGNQTYTPASGSLVVLVNEHGAPADIAPTDDVVCVKGRWTDKWNASTLQGKQLKISAPTTRALGVLQVQSITSARTDGKGTKD
ncbi:hypothetical protein [Fontivita pretiosa]|uniref:hypothetical protein n=1 Tax=Fontivita pretiosa TaxID=2989684 RepID=UPI003D16CA91